MATKYEYRVSRPGKVGGALVINNNGFIALDSSNSTQPTAEGQIAYVDGVGFRAYGETGVFTLGSGGGGTALGDLDGVYSNGQEVGIDEGPITLTDATTGALNTLVLVKTGAGSGNMLDLGVDAALTGNAVDIDMNLGVAAKAIYIDCGAGARTGADLQVKDDSTGAHSVIDIDSSGSGASVGLDWADSYNGSDASFGVKLTLDANDGIDATALQIVRNAGLRTVPAIDINEGSTGNTGVIDVDVSGVYTGNVVDIAFSAAATGNALFVNADNAVALTALHVEGSGARTQPLVEIATDCTGASDLIDIAVTGVSSGNIVDVDMGAAVTGNVFDIDMNLAVAAKAIYIDAGAGVRTAALVDLKHDGSGNVSAINIDQTNTGSGNIIEIDVDAVHTGNAIDINYGTSAATGDAIAITTGTNLAGNALQITTAGARTAPVINIVGGGTDGGTDDHVILITQSGLLNSNLVQLTYDTAASDGDALGITMGTNVAGSALAISGTGARTDDLIKIDSDQTDAGLIFDINLSGAGSGNCIDIEYSVAANTGHAISVTTGTNLAGNALLITTAGARTSPVILVTGAGTDAGTDDHIIDINQTGVLNSNVLDVTYSVGASDGNAVNLAMGTNVAGMAVNVSSAATGTDNEGCAFNVAHTGALVQGATVMRIDTTSNFANADGNVVEIIQRTGAGQVGNNALYISATGTNVEALKVDDGNVVFDENLTVSGTSTLTGAVTATLGVQATATARTATADGTTTAVIAAGTRVVVPTSDSADKWFTLPTPVLGNKITFLPSTDGTGYEVRAADPANQAVNNVSGANVELAVTGTDTIEFVCVVGGGSGKWIAYKISNVGATATAGTPDA